MSLARAVIDFFNRYLVQVQSGGGKGSSQRSSAEGSELLPTHQVLNQSDSAAARGTRTSGSSQYSTPDQVLAVLAHAVTHWRPESIRTFPQLRWVDGAFRQLAGTGEVHCNPLRGVVMIRSHTHPTITLACSLLRLGSS